MLVTVIQHCPNLELFTVEWSITPSFPAIADTLVSYSSRSLRSVQWKIGVDYLAGLIWALDALPSLVSITIDFENVSISLTPPDGASEMLEDTSPLLGTASHISLSLDCLEQLTLRGRSQEFVEQAIGWSLPALQSFTLDFASHRNNLPDVEEFLKHHGMQLTFLDLNTITALDLPAILVACPMLTSFSFNPDWRLPFHADVTDGRPATFLREPHPRITHLGLHQLLHAFLPPSEGTNDGAQAGAVPQVATMLLQRTNDLTFSQLTKTLFPALKVVRVLNRTLLAELERQNSPEGEGYARWERWDVQCRTEGVRLEDCTGALLGDLPMDSDDEWEEWEEDDSDHEYEHEEVDEPDGALRPSNVKELRDLLDDIRRMSVAEPMPFLSEEGFAALL
jgi:hypothetical protein